jgi:uncharacterized protein
MRFRSTFPRHVAVVPHVWITLSDGARLAARIWLPTDAAEHPVPALLEYTPYRKNDCTADQDASIHPYFAGHGYASVRVDLRGSGDSDGILEDEYLQRELEDGREVIVWLAAQPWCTGSVGMFGKSWGGFNSLQVASLRPPALKAVISVDSTDDRYVNDAHYYGGCLLGADILGWGSTLFAYSARPPDPKVVGDAWRAAWLRRLETPPPVERWLRHQRRDGFWRHGSVGEDYSRLGCAVYMIGGWADPYRNAVLRLLAGYRGPRKGLIGPWAHHYPHQGSPGPAIGFLQDALRWWDYWLKGVETGIMHEPMLHVWMQEWATPRTNFAERPGRWVAEETWPPARRPPRALGLGERTLTEPADVARAASTVEVSGVVQGGMESGPYCPSANGDLPPDQRGEDGRSCCFDSSPLADPIEILGSPTVTLTLSSDQPLALVACRLCDVAPDGASLLITRGMLNLAHRDGHEVPLRLEPGRPYEARIGLDAVAHRFDKGHRIRLAISPNYFPFAWPSPRTATLSIATQSSRIELPVRTPGPREPRLCPFEDPESAQRLCTEPQVDPRGKIRRLRHDLLAGRHELEAEMRNSVVHDGLSYAEQSLDSFSITDDRPLTAMLRSDWTIEMRRDDWSVRIETRSTLTSDAGAFHLTNELDAYERGSQVSERSWKVSVPRDGL